MLARKRAGEPLAGVGISWASGGMGVPRELRLGSIPAACVSQFDVALGGARSPHVGSPSSGPSPVIPNPKPSRLRGLTV